MGPFKSDIPDMALPTLSALRARRLPAELADLVIDCLDDDSTTLRACALVCRSWAPRARQHLFRAVRVCDIVVLQALQALLVRVPALRSAVRKLTISAVPLAAVLHSALGTLPRVEEILMFDLDEENTALDGVGRARLANLCKGLRTIRLSGVRFVQAMHAQLLFMSPRLQRVVFKDVLGVSGATGSPRADVPTHTEQQTALIRAASQGGRLTDYVVLLSVLKITCFRQPMLQAVDMDFTGTLAGDGGSTRFARVGTVPSASLQAADGLPWSWWVGFPVAASARDSEGMAKTLGECGNIEVITDCPRLASLPYFLLAVDAKKTEHLSLVYFGVGRPEWPWAAIDFALSDKRRWPELKSVRLVTLYASAHIPIPLRSCVKRGIDVVVQHKEYALSLAA